MTINITYSYEDCPTLLDFANSDAFMRAALGPFGSGKSSACVIEIVNRALAQEPGPDGVRRSRWGVVRNCFDDETEILTEARGWQLFKDLEPEDRVASLHGDSIVFERPTMHYSAPYQGEMIGMKTQHIDMLVTPDHHLWVSKQQTRARVWSAFQHEKASDAYGSVLRRFRTTATWDGPADSRSVAFYKFLGFWFAEGYAGAYIYPDRKEPHWRCVVVQKENLDLVREILRDAGLEWGENVSKVSGCTYFRVKIRQDLKPLIQELADLGPAVRKRLPLWVKQASCEQLQAFLNGYLFGDGTYGGGTVVTACTSSRALADDLQEIAVKAGYAASVGFSAQRSTGKFKSNSDFQYRVSIRNESRERPVGRGWYKREYDGVVYCVEVSTHVVLVRRNGKAHWSGQTYGELAATTMKTIFQWLPPMHFGRYVGQQHTYTVKAFPGTEFEIVFVALDRPDDVKRLLSLELTGAWVNEAREVPWGIIEVLQGRVGRYPAMKDGGATWHGVFLDTNPPDADSRFYKYFEEKGWLKDFLQMQRDGDMPKDMKPEQYAAIFKQPSGLAEDAENLANLPGGRRYYANLGAGKSEEWKKIYIHGRYGFVVEGKLVYPEYSDTLHCRAADPIQGQTIIRSWDWGLTPACVFSQMLPTGQWLTFDEMTSDNMSVDEFSDNVLEHCTRAFRGSVAFEDWGDPAGQNRHETDARSVFDILQAKSIDIRAAMTQEPTLRQEAVRKPLRTLVTGEPQFILHPRCRMLRKGFMGGYHRRKLQTAGPERYSEKPEKNEYSHCFPDGTMVATPRGAVPIESLRVGDQVVTPLGGRAVLATMNREAQQLVRLTTTSGRGVECTPDHPIWTARGFVHAEALSEDDVLQGLDSPDSLQLRVCLPLKTVRVYDLTVDEAHCFFANGILVSNCHDALQYGMVEYFGPGLIETPQNDDDFWERPSYGDDGRDPESGY